MSAGRLAFKTWPYTPESFLEHAVAKKLETHEEAVAAQIGARAAQIRKELGITQQEMAERLGVSQSYVSYYEKGELRLHGGMIAKVARVLGTSADELLGLNVTRERSSRRTAPAETPEARRLWRKFQEISKLPERDQRAVLRLINSIIGKRRD